MPTTQLMMQFWYEDTVFLPVTTITGGGASGTMNLDPHKTTVVREIATEETNGVLGINMPGAVNLSFTTKVFAEVDLIPAAGKSGGAFLLGPSCVPSPPFAEIAQLAFSISAGAFTAPPGGELVVQSVGAGGHVYVDQIS
jgi:hypothetical protein